MAWRTRRLMGPAAVAAVALLVAFAANSGQLSTSDTAGVPGTTTTVAPPVPRPMLVLYDTSGEWAEKGQIDSLLSANLLGHFGPVTRLPAQSYTAGTMASYAGVVYEGSTYDEPLPAALLDDVAAGSTPFVWAGLNIWQLDAHVEGGLSATFGFEAGLLDDSPMTVVHYRGQDLTRSKANDGSIVPITVDDATGATALATVDDGTKVPAARTTWAVRSGTLTYVGESPYDYVTEGDRYLAWSDLLLEAFAPTTPERHRALVRLEDIGPESDPKLVKASIDALVMRRVPFTMAVYPIFMDPGGAQGTAYGSTDVPPLRLDERPELVKVIRYGLAHGGEIVSHGYTHQYSDVANPYDGVSGKDFEFYRAVVDPVTDDVNLTGPLPGDSLAWATKRVTTARQMLAKAGIPLSNVRMFEVPHYAASPASSAAINDVYRGLNGDNPPTRYERGLYFPLLPSGEPDFPNATGQFFPYPVVDVDGSLIVPENLGNIIEVGYNNHDARMPSGIVANARRNLVVRDGVASFFYHPYLGAELLEQTLDGITALGYEFVSASSITAP